MKKFYKVKGEKLENAMFSKTNKRLKRDSGIDLNPSSDDDGEVELVLKDIDQRNY